MGDDRPGDAGDRLARLEARVRQLEDERDIRSLLARFAFLEDAMRDEDWLGLWTDDGVYDMVAVVPGPDGAPLETTKRYRGTAELRALMADPAGNRRPEFYGHALHTHAATNLVEVEGDTATVHAYTVLHQERDGALLAASAAANRWTLRRQDGRWLVAERVRRQVATPGFVEALADI